MTKVGIGWRLICVGVVVLIGVGVVVVLFGVGVVVVLIGVGVVLVLLVVRG